MANRLVSVDSDTLLFPDAVMGALDGEYKFGLLVSPSMTQAEIQSVLNGAAAGARVIFRPGTYTLAGPLVIAADSIHIDALKATFVQTTWGQPGFDAMGRNGCLFDIGLVQFTGTRGGQGSSFRGSAQYVSTAGVWINGDRNYVRNLRTSGMVCGVFLSSYAGTSANDRVGVGNRLGSVECDNYNFALLYVAQDGMIVDDIYGHDDLDDSGGANPTHVIYGSAITSFRATGGYIKSVRSKNNLSGQPVQVKFHDGLHIGSIQASNCKGLLNVIDSNDLKVDSYIGLGMLANGGQGAISLQRSVTNSQRPQFGPGFVQLASAVDEKVVNIISDNGVFGGITIETNHSVGISAAAAGGEITIRGTGNTLRKPKVRALGGAIPGIYAGFGETANGTLIDSPELSGVLSAVKVGSTSLGVTLVYDPAMQSITGSTMLDTNGGVESISTSSAPSASLSSLGENALLAAFATASLSGIANAALEVKIAPKRNITVTTFNWWSVTASGNYDVAIVDDLTNAVLWSKGSTAWPAAGKIAETVPSVKLLAGRKYRLAFAADNATGTLRMAAIPASGMDLLLDGGNASSTASSLTLPIGATLAAGSGGATRIPFIVLQGT